MDCPILIRVPLPLYLSFLAAFGNAKTRLNDNSSRFVSLWGALQRRLFVGGGSAAQSPRAVSLSQSLSLSFPFQGKYMEISFDFKGDPNGGLINSCECALSFDLRDHHNKFPLSLSSLFHPLFSAPPTVLLEKVSRACFDKAKGMREGGSVQLLILVLFWDSSKVLRIFDTPRFRGSMHIA